MQQILVSEFHTFCKESDSIVSEYLSKLKQKSPRIHCLTNSVTMQDVANALLAVGASAIMAPCPEEAADITAICHATLLNTGTPDSIRFLSCTLAGKKANALGHPVVLDPVGVGASSYRRENMHTLLSEVHPNLIRCNYEEALILLQLKGNISFPVEHGGVESGMDAEQTARVETAQNLANAYDCLVLITGSSDTVSDGKQTAIIRGGDARIARITGSGCMLSALCTAFLATDNSVPSVIAASVFWKQAAEFAGHEIDRLHLGLGSFHTYLFDALSR